MAETPTTSPLVRALHAHRTALAALGSFALHLSRRFGDPGTRDAETRYQAALAYAIKTRQAYDTLVREAIVQEHMGSNGTNGHATN